MREIELTRNKVAFVDDKDYEWLNQYKWYSDKSYNCWYAVRVIWVNKKFVKIYMHREILGLKKGDKIQVDHQNHNGLDNQRRNIRVSSQSQNNGNFCKTKGSSVYKGVCWDIRKKKWLAQIQFNNRHYFLGYFNNEEDAAHAYDKAALEFFGEFANLNFLEKELNGGKIRQAS
jgi:hypothetical protein